MISQATLRAAGRRAYSPSPVGCVLYVGGLAREVTIARIAEVFGAERVTGVRRPFDSAGHPRAFAFVTMASIEDAAKARHELDGATFEGRTISVAFVKDKYAHAA